MAQYKVPQDVEAEDKLIGPFSFRQFVYLLIAGGLIAMMVGLFQLFPLLAIIPLIPALLFLVLALPLKKDQPMETYLAALVSYYLKPRNRRWVPGQRESSILITAPKIVEEVRTRDLSEEEATHRLSFLADIVDTEGYAIKGMANSSMREDLVAEANATEDMFDTYKTPRLSRAIEDEQVERREEAIKGMREAIDRAENLAPSTATITNDRGLGREVEEEERKENVVIMPEKPETLKKPEAKSVNHSIMELANNTDYSVATIAKEANRINRKEEGEVYISLH